MTTPIEADPADAAPHVPVLLAEVLAGLAPHAAGRYIDGTFGAGGYTAAILAAGGAVLAIDRDPQAVARGTALAARHPGRLILAHDRFGRLDAIAHDRSFAPVDGVALDVGVSSMQVDEAERGFSFRFDGPLDMRMAAEGESAADIVNGASEARLADILYHYGEERLARPIAREIVAARKVRPIATTKALVEVVTSVVRPRFGQIHPATLTFQALRIAVNDELGELVAALHAAERVLRPGGVLAVVTFHSLEDRIVKQFLALRGGKGGGSRHDPLTPAGPPTFEPMTKKPIEPGEAERKANPRARSAKLRLARRNGTPARADIEARLEALAALPPEAKGRRR
jgi:16S rRNA (cytosine1402-N4)-methyltransferase